MPRRKTESEVATMEYIRTYTSIPVPVIHFYESNPYNRLGGEYIIMSKVRSVHLSPLIQNHVIYRNLHDRRKGFHCPPYTSPCHIKVLSPWSIILLPSLYPSSLIVFQALVHCTMDHHRKMPVL